MQSSIVSGGYLLAVAFIWGATNPLIKKGTVGVENIKQNNAVLQFYSEVKYLVLNWKCIIPFLLNQFGSVLYFFTLQNTDLSLAVPVANSLTFVFTWIVGQALGEEPVDKKTILGMVLIISGITLCFIDKAWYVIVWFIHSFLKKRKTSSISDLCSALSLLNEAEKTGTTKLKRKCLNFLDTYSSKDSQIE